MLPIRHPIPPVAVRPENYHRNRTANTRNNQISTDTQQQYQIFVVIFAAETIQPRQEGRDQQQRHAKREKELRNDEKRWQKEIMDDVVLFLEHPPTTSKTSIVVMAKILEIHKTHLPQSCNNKQKITMTTEHNRALSVV